MVAAYLHRLTLPICYLRRLHIYAFRRDVRLLVVIALLALMAVAMTLFISCCLNSMTTARSVDKSNRETAAVVDVVDSPWPRFVSAMCFDSRRLGNLMFNYASLLGVARVNGMVPVMPRYSNWSLPAAFDLKVLLISSDDSDIPALESFSPFLEQRPCAYDPQTAKLTDRNVMLHGFYQSWRYFMTSRKELIENFRFNERTTLAVDNSRVWRDLARNVSGSRPVVVGIHVRRGDYVTSPSNVAYGYTAAGQVYFLRAMTVFVERYPEVDFVVCSDDMQWALANVAVTPEMRAGRDRRIRLTYCDDSSNHDDTVDMAILSRADHVIMSTGTFGWWAAWLAGGTTIYYDGWPRTGSPLSRLVNKMDFFPPNWIPLT